MKSTFEQLIIEHSGRIRAIAKRYADYEGVDDLYQEILEQLWKSYKTFNNKASISTWVYRVSFNTAMTRLRKVVRQREGQKKLSAFKSLEAITSTRCQAEILEDFLDTLDDIDTSIMMMYLDGLTGVNMAEVLGIRVNAIQVRISRLKSAFSDCYMEVKSCS